MTSQQAKNAFPVLRVLSDHSSWFGGRVSRRREIVQEGLDPLGFLPEAVEECIVVRHRSASLPLLLRAWLTCSDNRPRLMGRRGAVLVLAGSTTRALERTANLKPFLDTPKPIFSKVGTSS